MEYVICAGMHVLGALDSVKEQGFDTASENWGLGMLFFLM